MCGIVGYVGKRDASSVLLDGLQRLVYRGYDSAGVAVHRNGGFSVRKVAGPVEDLGHLLSNGGRIDGWSGIGHTRWATHGRPTKENAHPHVDCTSRLAVVHNGIIENADELREGLRSRGHVIRTDTDTEVLAHLVEETQGADLAERLRIALSRVEGSYAVALISGDEKGRIIVARQGSPVLLGLGDGELLIASDAAAVREHTTRVIHLEDGDVAIVDSDGYRITDHGGRTLERSVTTLCYNGGDAELGEFEHYMRKEIHEQPESIRRSMAGRLDPRSGTVRLEGLDDVEDLVSEIKRVEIVACGTSWHAGLVGRYILEDITGLPVQVEYASEYRYKVRPDMPGTLTIAISQSGETADTLEAIRAAREKSLAIIGLVNTEGSTIARECDGNVFLRAGPEIGVASTKAFTSQISVLVLLGLWLGARRGTLDPARRRRFVEDLLRLPEHVRASLSSEDRAESLAEMFKDARGFLYLGRGVNFPVALEGALKLKEVSYIYAEGYPAAEMKHGPIALVDEKTPVVVVMPRDGLYQKVLSNVQEVKARGGRIVAVGARGCKELEALADYVLPASCSDNPLLTPVSTVVPLQFLAYHMALIRGCNVDRPRNLAKSVTVE